MSAVSCGLSATVINSGIEVSLWKLGIPSGCIGTFSLTSNTQSWLTQSKNENENVMECAATEQKGKCRVPQKVISRSSKARKLVLLERQRPLVTATNKLHLPLTPTLLHNPRLHLFGGHDSGLYHGNGAELLVNKLVRGLLITHFSEHRLSRCSQLQRDCD